MNAVANIDNHGQALLNVADLRVNYGDYQAVKGVSFQVARGETLALVGESGCGKSTTAMAIMRLLDGRADLSGTVDFDGINLSTISDPAMRGLRGNEISMVFQDPMTSLNPVLSIGEQIGEVLRRHRGLSRKDARAEALALLKKVRIPNAAARLDDFPHNLSGGQRQRVMIAIAVACNPRLLIADEPTTALDVTVQAHILQLLKELSEEYAMGLLLITHDLGVVGQWADRVAVMYDGLIVETGSTEAIFTAPQHPYTKGLLGASLRLDSPSHYASASLPEINVRPGANGLIEFDLHSHARYLTARDPGSDAAPILDVRNLRTEYKTRQGLVTAVDDVSFQIRPGETLGLVGESGCGKSTLSKTILGLIRSSAGQILLNGSDIAQLAEKQLRAHRPFVQMVFQDPYGSLNPKHNVYRILDGVLKNHGIKQAQERSRRILDIIQRVGLPASAVWKYPHEFSGGQRQRIGVARALILRPSLVILDEAVSSLDVSVRAQILNLLADLKEEFGLSYLFISHDLSVVKYMADRVLVMHDGKIVEEGAHEGIWKNARHDYTKKLIGSVPVPRYPVADDESVPYTNSAWQDLPVAMLLSRFAI
ncbi:ABC transporter ATP-binding protein [Pseudomonas sp. SZMC_28357]|uniref:ABC transporter ATP-binding protein n=1 Tax=Pseudomonas sp. SZMC_28357 TaxID=3074380 RepID=UPI00287144C4|nr:ABC transporter ATP-binding protein [Pseudomonas sp. SZMC_28357]MDR9754413.1 ABC transporter ATP-binding protein [Pseudomonas sp. SZMC_28357]